jgi:hypothetical protein
MRRYTTTLLRTGDAAIPAGTVAAGLLRTLESVTSYARALTSSARSVGAACRPQPATLEHPSAPPVVELVYELLDAHEDTARLAAKLQSDPEWLEHLDYLRDLQRVGREALAHAPIGHSQ